ncbi:MAG: AIR synthase-related protein [Phycisphaerae bacterium]|jgi:phosphoribosylformylglycinamidine synthase
MSVYCIEVSPRDRQGRPVADQTVLARLHEAGLSAVEQARTVRLFFVEGGLTRRQAEHIATDLLTDPVTESAAIRDEHQPHEPEAGAVEIEVHPRPGVMDPVAESTLAELRAESLPVDVVRTGRRHVVRGPVQPADVLATAARTLANDCIEQTVLGTAGVHPAPKPPVFRFELRHVSIRTLDDGGLERLSREGHLFLSLDEMRTVQAHFRDLDRDPTDLELETLAQTWSEHCVHKTLRSAIAYRGAAFPADGSPNPQQPIERRYGNLLKETIARATEELIAEGRGPECLSVFQDNAGIIRFDDEYGVAFKVETHNHPSAIEPYGGAATGIGGCIRDVLGCGLGAKPIANTDIFCVAGSDWPLDRLPKGVLHPRRVLRGIVKGVADYGNRMGIPTVNGAVCFDPRYLGNPLVYCGCVGLIPAAMVTKAACPDDLILLIGGRTGRDGIHGATFSSAELTDAHADEFSHAVQIGNAITEKRILDAILRARDEAGGCLYSAITDCGAGGLSSAVGEMGAEIGATVELERVPLKYAGLRYDEIWISEAQERMVLAVPPANLPRVLEIMQEEEVEATVIGTFGTGGGARLIVRYEGHIVGDIDMPFLHDGLPRSERRAEWQPTGELRTPRAPTPADPAALLAALRHELSRPVVAVKEWIIRRYDHEVQGGSAVKPLGGPGQGPGDAAVVRPRLDTHRAIALGCGITPQLGDVDPYWMAVAAIDEAVRNVVAVGGDPRQTAILDNFCWGRSDDPQQLGRLVRACQACYDVAKAYGVPFVSGKDSLNNEFALDEADVEPLLETLRAIAAGEATDAARLRDILPELEAHIRRTKRLAIPATLLISAMSIVPDARRCVTSDLRTAGDVLYLVGGLPVIGMSLTAAAAVHAAVAEAIQQGLIVACHDVSDGGWLTAAAEMAIAGDRGLRLTDAPANEDLPPFGELCAAYVVETARAADLRRLFESHGVRLVELGEVVAGGELTVGTARTRVHELRAAWRSAK